MRMLGDGLMKRKKFTFLIVATAILLLGSVIIISVAVGQGDEVDLNQVTLNDDPPLSRLEAEGGPFISLDAAVEIALSVAGDPNAQIVVTRLVSYSEALDLANARSTNLTIEGARQVYFVKLSGSFIFRKGPPGVPRRESSFAVIAVDAKTGDVVLLGEAPA